MTRSELLHILEETEIIQEDSHISPWWNLIHVPTGKIVTGFPVEFLHPMLKTVTPYCPRRFPTKSKARSALKKLFEVANYLPHS